MKELAKNIGIAGTLSLISLFLGFFSITLLIQNNINIAVIVLMLAIIFDVLDGIVARKYKTFSDFGRNLDSYVDAYNYLFFSSLLIFLYISSNIFGIGVAFLVIALGGLRLSRHNTEGILEDTKGAHYHGMTVVHILFVSIECYLLQKLTSFWTWQYSLLVISCFSTLMISNYKSYKKVGQYLLYIGMLCTTLIFLLLEYAY